MSMFIDQINEFQDNNDMAMLYLTLKDKITMETKQTISDCFQWMYEDDYFEEEENVWRIFVNNISKVLGRYWFR